MYRSCGTACTGAVVLPADIRGAGYTAVDPVAVGGQLA